MRYLLDTHIWIWSVLEPGKLDEAVIDVLEDRDNELWLSPISLWEMLVLLEKGRIEVSGDVDDWLAEAFRRAPIHEAPLTFEIAQQSRRLRLKHQDPADRFLGATAKVLDLTLITADRRMLVSKDFLVLPNGPVRSAPPVKPKRA